MSRVTFLPSLLLLVTIGAVGCNNRTVTAPTPVTSETFSGTLSQHDSLVHPFTTKQEGPVRITVISVARETPVLPENAPTPDTSQPPAVEDDPTAAIPPPIYIGLAIGTWDGSSCKLIAQRTDASLLTTISGNAQSGQFCVAVFDPGGDVITLPVDYQITVDHY